MFIYSLIISLGLQVIFSETPAIDCGYPNTIVEGCYKSREKVIVISYKDPNKNLYHELGHALFLNNQEVKDLVKTMPSFKKYPKEIYNTEEAVVNEKVADYFVMFITEKNFFWLYPELNELFIKYTSDKNEKISSVDCGRCFS